MVVGNRVVKFSSFLFLIIKEYNAESGFGKTKQFSKKYLKDIFFLNQEENSKSQINIEETLEKMYK